MNLDSRDDGIVCLLGINSLLNEVLEITGNGALTNMSQLNKIKLGVILLLKTKPPCEPLLEDGELRLKRIMLSRDFAVALITFRLEKIGTLLKAGRNESKKNQ